MEIPYIFLIYFYYFPYIFPWVLLNLFRQQYFLTRNRAGKQHLRTYGSFSFVLASRPPPRTSWETPWLPVMNDHAWCMMIHDAWSLMIYNDSWSSLMHDSWPWMMHDHPWCIMRHDSWLVCQSVLGGWCQKSYRQRCARHVGRQNGHETGRRESPEGIDYINFNSFSRRSDSWRREVARTLILGRNERFPGRLFRSIFGGFLGCP